MADAHKNFAESLIAVAPVPGMTGTSLTVTSTEGGLFPAAPFNATVWPAGAQPTSSNAEIVRVTNVVGDVLTITRAQENTTAQNIAVGNIIAATLTAKVMFDAENPIVTWSPFIMGSGATALQTLYTSLTNQSTTARMLMFPITVPQNMQFNQIILPMSLSFIAGNSLAAVNATYSSLFGLYTLNASTAFSLISSNSFSIGETVNSVSLSWYCPTTTATSGYGYGSLFPNGLTTTGQISSYISGTRYIGLQFGGNMYLGEGRYWLGLLALKNWGQGTSSSFGLSLAGLYGQGMNSVNWPLNTTGLMPFGVQGTQLTAYMSNFTQWRGKHIAGFLTASSLTNFNGNLIPTSFELSNLGGTSTSHTVTILPSITFVST